MSNNPAPVAVSEALSQTAPHDENDLVWGGLNLAKEINRTTAQFYYLHEKGALKGAVAKLGHKTFVGSRRKLRALFPG
jgi:hypothetical protein